VAIVGGIDLLFAPHKNEKAVSPFAPTAFSFYASLPVWLFFVSGYLSEVQSRS
jgi:hypothetical protein